MRNKLSRLAGSTIVAVVMASIVVTALPQSALADVLPTEDFQSFTAPEANLTAGNATANDWTYTGGLAHDIGIVETGIDGHSLRMSNATMNGSFGDWLFSKPLGTAATETDQQTFTAQFDIASTSPDLQQGLQVSVAPQTAGGARMTYLKFEDRADGIHVIFSDVMNLDEVVGLYPAEEDWRDVDIATLTDRDATHHVKIVMDLIPGAHNDVVQVYIDDSGPLVPGRTGEGATFDGYYAPVDNQPTTNKAKAGQTIPMKWRLAAPSFATSWEDYYRFNTESNANQGPGPFGTRQVDSLIFQARGTGTGVTAGGGFFIDNVSYSSTDETALPIAAGAGVSDPSVYDTPAFPFKATQSAAAECSPLEGPIDLIEAYATPGESALMYHGNGVWQYNVKTPKAWAGKCVELTLNGIDESATLFKFVK